MFKKSLACAKRYMASENTPTETPTNVEKTQKPKILEKQPTPLQDRPDLLSALLQN
jgi:hypothetical protein